LKKVVNKYFYYKELKMKKVIFCIVSILFYGLLFADEIATTSEGKKVLLRSDGKWEYIKNAVDDSKPSVQMARELFEKSIDNKIVKILTFKKTNAEEFDYYGQKIYVLYYQVEFEILQDCYYHLFDTYYCQLEKDEYFCEFQKKGSKLKYEDKKSFKKMENGWVEN